MKSDLKKGLGREGPTSPMEIGRFQDRLATAVGNRSVRDIARVAGISESVLRQYLKGKSEPTRPVLLAIANAVGVPVDWLVRGEGPMRPGDQETADRDDMVAIPEYAVEGSAGHGVVASAEEMESVWWFSRRLAHELGLNPANLAFIRVQGDSMSPGVNNGDLVMIDLTEKRFRNEGVYAFILGDMLLVKRIQPQPGGEFQARSDNPAYSPITLKPGADQVTVVGRVVYAMHRFT